MFFRRACDLRLSVAGRDQIVKSSRKRNILTFLARSDRRRSSRRRKVAAVRRYRFVNRADYPPLIRRSSFLARAFRFETAITAARASERASVSNSSSLRERTRLALALAISPRKTTRGSGEKKEKAKRTPAKKGRPSALEAPLRIIIMRLSRGAKRTRSIVRRFKDRSPSPPFFPSFLRYP